ncbi:hypothetical protein BJ166DRAFT_178643 [Pestalotiopsis sp. NC0098]|nr:hypothetical protein BJ166DRAFT_178643 [Pestalotiopsis sp. NC0098]
MKVQGPVVGGCVGLGWVRGQARQARQAFVRDPDHPRVADIQFVQIEPTKDKNPILPLNSQEREQPGGTGRYGKKKTKKKRVWRQHAHAIVTWEYSSTIIFHYATEPGKRTFCITAKRLSTYVRTNLPTCVLCSRSRGRLLSKPTHTHFQNIHDNSWVALSPTIIHSIYTTYCTYSTHSTYTHIHGACPT